MNDDMRSMLSPDELRVLAGFGKVRNFQKKVVVISEGDETTSFYAIEDGEVEVYCADENGKEITLNLLADGEYFGELVIISEGSRSASVRTVRPSKFIVVSKADFERCLTENPEMLLKLTRYLANRVRELTEQVSDLALVAVYGRLVGALKKLAKPRADGKSVIEKRFPHLTMARQIGTSRVMVTRILGDLETGDYLVRDGEGWVIPGRIPEKW